MTRPLVVAFPLVAVALCPAADEPKPSDLVFVQKGTLPIILSAPHGGRAKVPDVPARTETELPNFATVRDENTAELTEKLAAEVEKLLGGKPWVVIARFERRYIDANRPPEHGYESEKAKPHYDAYHTALADACKAVRAKHKRGLLLDIHGQAAFPDAVCRGTQNLKTVKLLRDRDGMAAIRGKSSVLGHFEKLGYAVRPAADADETAKEEPRFTGGHIVGTYGSHTAFAVDAIQLELGSNLRTKDKYEATAKNLADAVRVFYDAYLKE